MAFYPQSILDEIRDRISITSYIGEQVPLKKSGKNYKGVCPFHAEKTPSFMVNEDKEIFHCFGCGEGGNLFTFVMKYERISFPEAVEHLAARAGVELPKQKLSSAELSQIERAAREKKLLLSVNKIVAQFFRQNLLGAGFGESSRNYLKKRNIFNEISTQHFLGSADDNWETLCRYLKSRNVPMNLPLGLGLVRQREASNEFYDFFRGRLIFPIISARFEVVGFGGRIISDAGDDVAKYLNSPDSPIYHKSHSVYALNVAQKEVRQKDQVIIVEGYMDVLALNQAGMSNVVAPLGTALTVGQIKLLMRYSKNMVLIFDGDEAGIRAAEKSLSSFMEVGVMPKVVVLPDGKDPDEWIREGSREKLEEIIVAADPILDWYIKRRAALCKTDVSGKAGVVSELKPFFGRIGGAVEFSHYRKLLSDELKIDENDLVKQIGYAGQKDRDRKLFVRSEQGGMAGRLRTEKLLLALMLEYPGFVNRVNSSIDVSYFTDESYKTLFDYLVKAADKGKLSVGRLLDEAGDDEIANAIHSLSVSDDVDDENASVVLEDCIKYLMKNRLSERLRIITEEIKTAEGSKDDDKVIKLILEKNKLLLENA